MKKIIEAIKNYKFKIITTIGIMGLLIILDNVFKTDIFHGWVVMLFSGLLLFTYLAIWTSVINLWREDGMIGGAIACAVIVTGFFALWIYLLLFTK